MAPVRALSKKLWTMYENEMADAAKQFRNKNTTCACVFSKIDWDDASVSRKFSNTKTRACVA